MLAFLALVRAEDVCAGFERDGLQEGEPAWAGVGLCAASVDDRKKFEKGSLYGHGEREDGMMEQDTWRKGEMEGESVL